MAAAMVAASIAAQAQTLENVKRAGEVRCGVEPELAGFSSIDSKGEWRGLDVDVCRAVASVALGDPRKVKFVALTPQTRFTALQSGEIDLLTFDTTWTLARETTAGLLFAGVNFYDGQGFMVRSDSSVDSAKKLDGAIVCLRPGTVTELNLSDFQRMNKIKLQPVLIEALPQSIGAFQSGRCDAYTGDSSALASIRSGLPKPDSVRILPELISKEPLGPSVRSDDTRSSWLECAMAQRWPHVCASHQVRFARSPWQRRNAATGTWRGAQVLAARKGGAQSDSMKACILVVRNATNCSTAPGSRRCERTRRCALASASNGSDNGTTRKRPSPTSVAAANLGNRVTPQPVIA